MSTGIQFIEMRHIQAKKWSCCLEEKTTAGSIKIKLFFLWKMRKCSIHCCREDLSWG